MQAAGVAVVLALPASCLLVLSFFSGGFFPDATAVAALVLLLALMVRVTTAPTPFAGVSPGLRLCAAALLAPSLRGL